jgi:DNA-binding HxlR family transcriptional regulator
MKGYGQFCSFARALDLLGERWTLLVVREFLSGSTRFGEIQRGIPPDLDTQDTLSPA